MTESQKEHEKQALLQRIKKPTSDRIFFIRLALLSGASIDDIYFATKIDRWFLHNLKEITDMELNLRALAAS
jgi:carbamoyl-phosphate synthase large subunit